MPYEPIIPAGFRTFAPYSPATKAGNVVYVSGTVALDKEGKLVGAGDVKAQTRFVLDVKDFSAMNQVYREYFPEAPPARYCIRADLVNPELLVEIAATAHLA